MRRELLCVLLAFLTVAAASGQSPHEAEFYSLGAELASGNWEQSSGDGSASDNMAKEKLKRIAEGLPSLLIPGWSQWRQGNHRRAALLAGAEAAVWTSWVVFRIQGNRREDSYEEYAVNFAGVNGVDHPEDYWKALAVYISSLEYNENRRLDLRAGGELDGPAYEGDLAWEWSSPNSLEEYRRLRTSSLSAFDRAENVVALALLTRALAFIDAVRTALIRGGAEPEEGGEFGLHMRSRSIDGEPSTELGLRLSF